MPNYFAPDILSDPAIIDQHRLVVEALERECVQQRLHCREAEAARRSLSKREQR